MIYIESAITDPAFNLAMEEYLFDRMDRAHSYFMLWQNDNTVVVGKHQNTAREVDAAYVKEKNIHVVRRLSGGGAVYHDLGNLNFTIIQDAQASGRLDFACFTAPLVAALKGLGVNAVAGGRNDVTVEGAKFSGNAQYVREGRVMHHGTIMVDSDLSVLGRVLQVSQDKFKDKAVQSVRARVTNLAPFLSGAGVAEVKAALLAQMDAENGLQQGALTQADMDSIRDIAKSRYDCWDWNWGKSPAFEVEKKRRFDGVGTVQVCMTLAKGRITSFQSYGDYFGEGATPQLGELLSGCPAEADALRGALAGLDIGRLFHNLTLEDFIRLIVE